MKLIVIIGGFGVCDLSVLCGSVIKSLVYHLLFIMPLFFLHCFFEYSLKGSFRMNSFNLFLSWKLYLFPSIIVDYSSGCNSPGRHLYSLVTCNPFSRLIAFRDSFEKSAVILIGFSLYMDCGFSLLAFNVLFFVNMFSVLTIICYGDFLFWSCLFGVLCVSSVCFYFSQFGEVFFSHSFKNLVYDIHLGFFSYACRLCIWSFVVF